MPTKRRQDARRRFALRVYPAALAGTLIVLALFADTPVGLEGPDWWGDTTAALGAACSAAAALRPVRMVRFVHLLTALLAATSRCLFILLGWAGDWGWSSQLLGIAVWGLVDVATLTIYLLAMPYVAADGQLLQARVVPAEEAA